MIGYFCRNYWFAAGNIFCNLAGIAPPFNFTGAIGNNNYITGIDKNRDFVVVETKKGKESDKVVGQIQRYMGWITRNLAKNGESVRGIIIVNECDEWLDYAVSVNDNSQWKYYEVKFAVRDAPPGKHL